jgi:type IV secretion system protein VirB1
MSLFLMRQEASASETIEHLVGRCAPWMAPATALGIIDAESSGVWYAVNDNDATAPTFATPEAAIAYAERRVSEGGSIDLGLGQLNSSHLAAYGVTVREAFEPCLNVKLSMAVMWDAWVDARARFGFTPNALYHAFEAYNGGEGSWNPGDPRHERVVGYANHLWAVVSSFARSYVARRPPVVVLARVPQHGIRIVYASGVK